jgi:hypothetical protein
VALALVAALVCALASGWCAVKITDAFRRVTPEHALRLERFEPVPAKS